MAAVRSAQERENKSESVGEGGSCGSYFPFWLDINFYLVIAAQQLSQSGPTLPCLHSNCELPTHTGLCVYMPVSVCSWAAHVVNLKCSTYEEAHCWNLSIISNFTAKSINSAQQLIDTQTVAEKSRIFAWIYYIYRVTTRIKKPIYAETQWVIADDQGGRTGWHTQLGQHSTQNHIKLT